MKNSKLIPNGENWTKALFRTHRTLW